MHENTGDRRRQDSWGRTCASGCSRRSMRSSAWIIFLPADGGIFTRTSGIPDFEVVRHDVIEPILLEVDRIYHLACPASPVQLPVQPGQNDQDETSWGPTTCWGLPNGPGRGSCWHRRPRSTATRRSPPDRGLLGQCESHRDPELLRRRKTRGRDLHHGLSPPEPRRRQDRPHLQHLWGRACWQMTEGS